jgi:hypothetical protein
VDPVLNRNIGALYEVLSLIVMENIMFKCPKCSGTGTLSCFMHIDNGVCFRCDGLGEVESLEKEEQDPSEIAKIYSLYSRSESGEITLVQFYIWPENANSERAGSGFISSSTASVEWVLNKDRTNSFNPDDPACRESLEVLRAKYSQAKARGLQTVTDEVWNEYEEKMDEAYNRAY